MEQRYNPIRGVLLLFLISVTAVFLYGCAATLLVERDQLNTGDTPSAQSAQLPDIIYAVAFKALDTTMDVKKFGILTPDQDPVSIRHGLSYPVDLYSLSSMSEMELKMILKRNGLGSLKDFIKKLEGRSPVIHGSEYKPVSRALGVTLFDFAVRNNQDHHEMFLPLQP